MSNSQFTTYRSYLLRLWRQSPQGPWCASLENVQTRQINYFARPEELWAFLQAEMANQLTPAGSTPDPELTTTSGFGTPADID